MAQSNTMLSAFNIKEKYSSFSSKGSMHGYLLQLSEQNLDEILAGFEQFLENINISKPEVKRAYNILIESLQNIKKYTKGLSNKSYKESFALVKREYGRTSVITGNYLLKDDINGVKSRIEMVNELSDDELRDLYRGVLDIGEATLDGGAGLGIIDMAKRSTGKISASYDQVDQNYVFFTLQFVVDN